LTPRNQSNRFKKSSPGAKSPGAPCAYINSIVLMMIWQGLAQQNDQGWGRQTLRTPIETVVCHSIVYPWTVQGLYTSSCAHPKSFACPAQQNAMASKSALAFFRYFIVHEVLIVDPTLFRLFGLRRKLASLYHKDRLPNAARWADNSPKRPPSVHLGLYGR